MTEPATEAPVHYRFSSVSQGVQLEIWELASPPAQAEHPFLFRVKYLLPSRRDAELALEDYLRHNGLSFADDSPDTQADAGDGRLLSNRDTRS